MKKVLIAIAVLIVLVFLGFLFFFDGSSRISDFFTENNDFGSFFDIDPQSQNDFVAQPGPATSTPVAPGPYVAPVLRQLSLEPVSGYTFFSTTTVSTSTRIDPERGEVTQEITSTSTAVRFQERATGHTYDVFKFLQSPIKSSNITVQRVYRTLFTNDKDAFYTQAPVQNNEYVDTSLVRIIPAKPATATASSTEQTIQQSSISSSFGDFTYVADSNKIAYSVRRENGTGLYTADPQRAKETLVTTLPFSEFTIEPINGTHLLIQTKASAGAFGYAYILNTSTGVLGKILGQIPGLLARVSPDLSYYLYSESAAGRTIIRSYDVEEETARQIGINTIPEKCAFSNTNGAEIYCFGSPSYASAAYPDDWYKGRVFNEEDLYKINLATGAVENVYIFEPGTAPDTMNVQLSQNNDMIAFQNKYDLTLWALDLAALNNQFN